MHFWGKKLTFKDSALKGIGSTIYSGVELDDDLCIKGIQLHLETQIVMNGEGVAAKTPSVPFRFDGIELETEGFQIIHRMPWSGMAVTGDIM